MLHLNTRHYPTNDLRPCALLLSHRPAPATHHRQHSSDEGLGVNLTSCLAISLNVLSQVQQELGLHCPCHNPTHALSSSCSVPNAAAPQELPPNTRGSPPLQALPLPPPRPVAYRAATRASAASPSASALPNTQTVPGRVGTGRWGCGVWVGWWCVCVCGGGGAAVCRARLLPAVWSARLQAAPPAPPFPRAPTSAAAAGDLGPQERRIPAPGGRRVLLLPHQLHQPAGVSGGGGACMRACVRARGGGGGVYGRMCVCVWGADTRGPARRRPGPARLSVAGQPRPQAP